MKYLLWPILFLQCSFPLFLSADQPNIIIILTDDHGYADLGCQGINQDVQTPYLDQLAARGVLFKDAYVTSPQCTPSRAGLMVGRDQNRFGLEQNGYGGLPYSEVTLAERLKHAGYVTGMAGKWHLGTKPVDGVEFFSNGELPNGDTLSSSRLNYLQDNHKIKGLRGAKAFNFRVSKDNLGHVGYHGFDEFMQGPKTRAAATHAIDGTKLGGVVDYKDPNYRIESQTNWALNFIDRHAGGEAPFFLYLSYFAPHVPLEAPDKYLERFSEDLPWNRRMGLAMIASVDDGVGQLVAMLKDLGELENTLVFYLGDNGAIERGRKETIGKVQGPWDGSINDPWIGEKGTLLEGGIRVPYIVSWPNGLPAGMTYTGPVSSLDIAATAVIAAGQATDDRLEGLNLVNLLTQVEGGSQQRTLCWKWNNQAAIRSGKWKYYRLGDQAYLFDLTHPEHERYNQLSAQPERAQNLQAMLNQWSDANFINTLPGPVDSKTLQRFNRSYFK